MISKVKLGKRFSDNCSILIAIRISDYEKNILGIFQIASNLGIRVSSINFSRPSLEDVISTKYKLGTPKQ
jgi:hypothetical protein